MYLCTGYMNSPVRDNDRKVRTRGSHKFLLFDEEDQACIQPRLPVWDASTNFTGVCEHVVCSTEDNWVFTRGGRFYIEAKATEKHGHIVCAAQPIIFKNDKAGFLPKIAPMLNGSELQSDAFKVTCKAKDGAQYVNVHAGVSKVAMQPSNIYRSSVIADDKFNVLILGFDSMSRQAVQRLIPQTRKFFEDKLGGVLLEGINILGDGTTQALLPMLTGSLETEIPEVRREYPNVRYVDEAVELIWKRYEKQGYVTSWAEDMPTIGTFHYRMKGFKNQPVHHYLRPYFLEAGRVQSHFKKHCMGSKPAHQVFIDWIKETMNTEEDHFFTFGFLSEYSHNDNKCMARTDLDIAQFLEYVSHHKTLRNTFIFLMSDHGLRVGKSRQTEHGKLEERMPYFAVYMPKGYIDKYPIKYENLLSNSKRLTTVFDIYETLRDILGDINENRVKPDNDNAKSYTPPRGYSLFSPIPASRTCADAGIEPHWCACLKWDSVSVHEKHVIDVATFAVSRFNSMLKEKTDKCKTLRLKQILKAIKLKTNENLLKFKGSLDHDGRVPDFSDKTNVTKTFYQITMETEPGGGMFEITSSIHSISGEVTVNKRDISRLNLYNDDPKCIQETYPFLQPFCVCLST